MAAPAHRRPLLTPQRLAMLRRIRDVYAATGDGPTMRELGPNQAQVIAQLTALDALGLIYWPPGVARGYRVTARGEAALQQTAEVET